MIIFVDFVSIFNGQQSFGFPLRLCAFAGNNRKNPQIPSGAKKKCEEFSTHICALTKALVLIEKIYFFFSLSGQLFVFSMHYYG